MAVEPGDIAAGLPPARDDEPATLRQDIADELADHLACALGREKRANSPEQSDQAAQAVLQQFGDPAAVARRLWWDAMKEKIMAQRLTMIALAALTATCVFLCVLVWQMRRDSGEALAALLQSEREANKALISELKTALAGSPREGAWLPLTVKLAVRSDGLSERGVPGEVSLSGKPFGNDTFLSDYVTTGSDGIARLQPVPPGKYQIGVLSKHSNERTNFDFVVGPGRANEKVVLCPPKAPSKGHIRFDIDQDFAAYRIFYLAVVRPDSRFYEGRRWRPVAGGRAESRQVPGVPGSVASNYPGEVILLLDRSGKVLGEVSKKAVQAPLLQGATMYVAWKSELTDVALARPPELLAYQYQASLHAYVAERETADAATAPPMKRVGTMTDLVASGPLRCYLDPSRQAFWKQLEQNLREMPDSKRFMKKVIDGPAAPTGD